MLRKLFKQPVVLASTIIALALLAFPFAAAAQGIPMLSVTGGPKGQQQYSLSLQLLALMTSLTLLPSFLLMMTAFVRIIIVLSILRQALGTGQTPPNTVLVGLSLFLTLFTNVETLRAANRGCISGWNNSSGGTGLHIHSRASSASSSTGLRL
jgi:flagellar biosynthetic protein FliP